MNAAQLRLMLEAGLTLEQVVKIAEAADEPKRSSGAERQRRYRERLSGTGMTSTQWSETSKRILGRDGHACRYCSAPAACVDHVIPLNQGGSSDDENLVAARKACNSGKSGKSLSEWKGADWAASWQASNASHNASQEAPLPLPLSPQTPLSPAPTPGKNTRTRKAASAEPAQPDITERVWRAASPVSRTRSGRPALGKAVLAAIKAGATDEALLASVSAHCASQGEFAKGVHLIVSGEHWRDHQAKAQPDRPPDPALTAARLQHFAKTGEWKPTWGPKPHANDHHTPDHGAAA
jgi:5-methylcytosine-specific restriction endonuclease McrA